MVLHHCCTFENQRCSDHFDHFWLTVLTSSLPLCYLCDHWNQEYLFGKIWTVLYFFPTVLHLQQVPNGLLCLLQNNWYSILDSQRLRYGWAIIPSNHISFFFITVAWNPQSLLIDWNWAHFQLFKPGTLLEFVCDGHLFKVILSGIQ